MDNKQMFFPFFLLSCCLVINVSGMIDGEYADSESVATQACAVEGAQRGPQLKYNERNELNQLFIQALKKRYGKDLRYLFARFNLNQASLQKVIDALEHGADVNCSLPCGYGCVALHIAAHNGDIALVRELLKYGGNTSARDGHNDTPFLLAAGQVHDHYRSFLSPEEEQEILQSKEPTIIDYCYVLCELWHKSTKDDKRYFIDPYGQAYRTEAEGSGRLYYVDQAIEIVKKILGCAIEDYDPLDNFEGT